MSMHSRTSTSEVRSDRIISGSLLMTSVRKREWTSPKGEAKSAWVVDYLDQAGKRRHKTFARKKEADAYSATAVVEVRSGIHTPDSQSIAVARAAELWLASCSNLERTTVDSYRAHVDAPHQPVSRPHEALAAHGPHGARVRGQAAEGRASAERGHRQEAIDRDGEAHHRQPRLHADRCAGTRADRPQRRAGSPRQPQEGQGATCGAAPEGQAQGRGRYPCPARDQGHRGSPGRQVAADPDDRDLHRPTSLRTSRSAVGSTSTSAAASCMSGSGPTDTRRSGSRSRRLASAASPCPRCWSRS